MNKRKLIYIIMLVVAATFPLR